MFFCFAVGADFPLKQQMVFDYHLFYMTYWVLHHLMFQIRVILNPCCRVFWSGRKSLWGSDFFSTVQTAVYVIFRQTGGTLCCLWVSLCGCCFVRMRQAAACWCMALQMLHDASPSHRLKLRVWAAERTKPGRPGHPAARRLRRCSQTSRSSQEWRRAEVLLKTRRTRRSWSSLTICSPVWISAASSTSGSHRWGMWRESNTHTQTRRGFRLSSP